MTTNRLGRYALERKIATGGMAEIWLARQDGPAGFEKELVIKRILPHLADDQKFVEMFLDEARLAARLAHPNIVQIFDLGETEGDYFIAMEFIDGVDLSDVVERAESLGTTVPPAIAARLIADACQALDYAHHFRDKDGTAIELVHRDISPQNILLSRSGIVKVVDFGVAKAATSQHKTQTGAVKGKLSYMSPEQIAGKGIDGRSDLFALGIVLYELVTTQRPFGHESELLAVTAILNEQPTAPRTLVDGVPSELESIIFRALEKGKEDRYESAREMQMALESVLHEMGALLSSRDLAEYLEDLFSDAPTHMVGQLPALAPTIVTDDVANARRAAVTAPVHPSATTRHGAAAPTPVDDPTGVRLKGVLARSGSTDVEVPPPEARRGGLGVAILVALVLVSGAAFGVWTLIRGDGDGTPDDSVAAVVDGASESASATAATAAGTGADRASEVTAENEQAAGTADGSADVAEVPAAAESGAEQDPENIATAEQDTTGEDEATAERDASAEQAATTDQDATGSPEAEANPASADAAAEELAGTSNVEAAGDAEQPEPEVEDDRAQPEPETSRPTPPARQVGTLRVVGPAGVSQTVYINGRQRGRARMGTQTFELEVGSYQVRTENAAGESWETSVRVERGQSPRVSPRY